VLLSHLFSLDMDKLFDFYHYHQLYWYTRVWPGRSGDMLLERAGGEVAMRGDIVCSWIKLAVQGETSLVELTSQLRS